MGVASYGNDDEWIDVGGRSKCVTLHVHEWLHICRDGMHIASKLGTCVCLALSQVTLLGGTVFCVLTEW